MNTNQSHSNAAHPNPQLLPALPLETPADRQKVDQVSLGALGTLDVLSEAEKLELVTFEVIIGSGWQTFVEVGLALAGIRDHRLYREDFSTFQEYCRTKWQYGRNYVDRMISAAQVFRHLMTNCHQKPEYESQVRPLVGLTPEKAKEVWELAVKMAAGRRITARLVQIALKELQAPGGAPPATEPPAPTKAELRQLVTSAMTELLTLLHQRAEHSSLVEKAETLHRHIQSAFAVKKKLRQA